MAKAANKFTYPFSSTALRDLEQLHTHASEFWEKKGERMALSLTRYMQNEVPAYQAFLREQGIDPAVPTRTLKQFAKLPIVTKDNYLRASNYGDLFAPGALHKSTTVSATSGSTGEPFFFPRDASHDRFYERALEILLTNQWQVGSRKTLCIIGFGLGIWIGGIFTYKNLNKLADSKLPMTLIPVGPHKDLYLKAFQKFAPHFDQIILSGYPPFIKDLLDAGKEQGVIWSDHRIRILTAAEGYSERFRNHLSELSGADPVLDMVNIYGTVEQGTIAHETALANMIRRLADGNSDLFKDLFPTAQNIPTLAQYYPDHIYFEEIDGGIVATGYGSSIPLVRYSFSDLGGVISFQTMREKLSAHGFDLDNEIKKHGIQDTVAQLPFVYVHARGDFAIVFRGANLFPEEIRAALDIKTLADVVTGKFTAIRREDESMQQHLDIHVELTAHTIADEDIRKRVTDHIVQELRNRNSEFNNNYSSDAASSTPNVILHAHEDPEYFSGAGKQQWVRK